MIIMEMEIKLKPCPFCGARSLIGNGPRLTEKQFMKCIAQTVQLLLTVGSIAKKKPLKPGTSERTRRRIKTERGYITNRKECFIVRNVENTLSITFIITVCGAVQRWTRRESE